MDRKLYRSRRDRVISGVCGGIAEYFEVDPTLVRLIAAALAVVSFGTAVLVYLVMAIVVPEEPPEAAEGRGFPVSETPGVPVQTQPQPEAGNPPGAPPSPPSSWYSSQPRPPYGRRPRRGGIWFGVVLVVIGLLLLASEFAPGLDLWRLWPLVIVLIGVRILFRGRER